LRLEVEASIRIALKNPPVCPGAQGAPGHLFSREC